MKKYVWYVLLLVSFFAAISLQPLQKTAASVVSADAKQAPNVFSMLETKSFADMITDSALKYIDSKTLKEVINRINKTNSSEIELFSSTVNAQEMLVYNVTTPLSGTVNRHLGNKLGGHKVDPSIVDETLNLQGYTIYLVINTNDKQIIQAHFIPTKYRTKETVYHRYVSNYDVQLHAQYNRSKAYLKPSGENDVHFLQALGRATNARNAYLIKDSQNLHSIIPKK